MNYEDVKILIVEDEVFIAETIKSHLIKLGFRFIKMAHSKVDALGLISTWLPDAVLLDIRMEERDDGLEIGKIIFKDYGIPFMYVTSHSDLEMTQKIIETRPNGYITKPIRINEFMVSIRMLIDFVEKNHVMRKISSTKDAILPVLAKNIIYLQASGNYWELISYKKKFLLRVNFEELIELLPDDMFVRIHRSFIVNKIAVSKFSSTEVILINNEILPISRGLSKEVKSALS